MTLKEHFLKLMEAETWATGVLAETLAKAKQPDERALLLFSHILSSYSMWLSRLTGSEITTTLFQERSLDESKKLMVDVFGALKHYLQQADDNEMNRVIEFTFPLDGSRRRLSVSDAITHLATHSSYHRGQIMTRLKDQVESLPLTTYIAYAMEKVN